jgi:hypothetical protein
MDETAYFFSASREDGTTLYIAELADAEAIAAGYDPADAIGYFLYKLRGSEPHSIEVLARIDDHTAAFELSRMLGLR